MQVMNLMCYRLSLYMPSSLPEFGKARLPRWEWRWTERSCRTGRRTRECGARCWPWGDNRSKSRASTAGSFVWGDYKYRYFTWGLRILLHRLRQQVVVSETDSLCPQNSYWYWHNKNKLNSIYVNCQTQLCLLRHNYMFRPSLLAIFRLYMRKLINKLYQHVCGIYRLWGGVDARSHLCQRKWHGLGLFRGRVEVTSMSTYSYV